MTSWRPLLGVVLALTGSAIPATASTLLQTLRNGEGGVTGLDGASGVAVSPDGAHVFVASANEDALVVFSRDTATGLLSPFAVFQDQIGGVSGLDGARDVAVALDGKNVYVASPGSDAVAVFSRDTTSGALTFVEAETQGLGSATGPEPASVEVTPDGERVLVPSTSLVVFTRDPLDGSLAYDSIVGWWGMSAYAQSPEGRHVYASSPIPLKEGGGSVVDVATWGDDGQYTHRILPGAQVALPCVSPDGLFVYGTWSGIEGEICWWARDAETAALTKVDCVQPPLTPTTRIVASPDGASVYIQSGARLFQFPRDSTTGALAEPRDLGTVGFLRGLAVSPDSRHVLAGQEVDVLDGPDESNLL